MRITSLVLRVRNIDKVSAFYEKVGLQLNEKYQNEYMNSVLNRDSTMLTNHH